MILPKFLYYCLSSPYFQSIVQSKLNGATTPHLYQRDITEFPVFLPPLSEQERIVANLEALRSDAQRLESLNEQEQATLKELKKSLLHQAFSGQL
jgi:type I restriction enzyme S subunit